MTDAVTRRCRPGSIIIMHVNGRGWHTAEALPEILRRLRAKGYRFVTVSQLLG
jgi:peptidoglycan/xylan/chitin deacetylase (PgdA/CDA1 family)